MAKENKFWVGPKIIMKATGFNKDEMRSLRKNNPDWWTQKKGRNEYLYDWNMVLNKPLKETA